MKFGDRAPFSQTGRSDDPASYSAPVLADVGGEAGDEQGL